ncbi:Hypothetical predicted protein [Paramuricea clavata]|uniref:Uncharacterized protein n=1 Tax=Paramuricea clavata TaxID=317549 RepID=A0A7D9EBE4_PARCT|nr:Hypothetical predicted protein [Paramuricea clavata]
MKLGRFVISVVAVCSATGGPHYKTFDGRRYNFMGKCEYVLAKDSNETFMILQDSEPCGRGKATCTNAVTVNIQGTIIYLRRGENVLVNGANVTLPYSNQGMNIKTFKKRGIKITTDIDLIVEYDGVFNVFVKVTNSYKGKLSGLCGNFNGKRGDEFKTPKDKLVQKAVTFGNSWKIGDSCPDVESVEEDPCKNASKRAQKAKEECSALKKQPFSRCRKALDPNAGYIKDCEYDVCACEDNPKACLCESFAAYEEACDDLGIEVKWKHLKKFAKCSKLKYIELK